MPADTTADVLACLDRLRAGDPQARGALIICVYEHLRRLADRQMCGFERIRRFADVNDVMQNVYLRLARRLLTDTPEGAAEFFSWASREIRCELLDLIRKHFGSCGAGRHELPWPDDSSSGDPAETTYVPDRLADWSEFHNQIERLPVAERCVFDLRWYQGMTWNETADVLNMSPATVKRHWVNARIRLKSVLNLDGEFW